MPFIPRDEKYFSMLNQLVGRIRHGADLLVRLFDDVSQNEKFSDEIKDVERECDRLSSGIIERLNSTFITPIDREDIYTLASELDDIMDMVNDIARVTVLYGVKEASAASRQLTKVLFDAVVELEKAFVVLESRKGVREHIERIKMLEEEGDRASHGAVQRLFANEANPLEVIRWLKIYEELEAGIDRCKDVAKVLEAIIVKNA
jgi:hypothetical protein